MTKKPSKLARREAAQRAARRRRYRIWGGLAGAAITLVATFAVLSLGAGSQVGALAPDFELASPGGEAVRLSDYRGQPVALTFMHTY